MQLPAISQGRFAQNKRAVCTYSREERVESYCQVHLFESDIPNVLFSKFIVNEPHTEKATSPFLLFVTVHDAIIGLLLGKFFLSSIDL